MLWTAFFSTMRVRRFINRKLQKVASTAPASGQPALLGSSSRGDTGGPGGGRAAAGGLWRAPVEPLIFQKQTGPVGQCLVPFAPTCEPLKGSLREGREVGDRVGGHILHQEEKALLGGRRGGVRGSFLNRPVACSYHRWVAPHSRWWLKRSYPPIF